MRRFICALFFLLIIIANVLTSFQKNTRTDPMENRLSPVHDLIENLARQFSKKYALLPAGITLGTPGGRIEVLGIEFQKKSNSPLSINQSRELLVAISTEFIQSVNENPDVYKLLKSPPFDVSDLKLAIFLQDQRDNHRHYPDLTVIHVSNGAFSYESWADDPEWILKTVTSHTESYEEAKAILEKQKSQPPCTP